MIEQDYNGWANRETWALMLHVNNDQGLQDSALDIARAIVRGVDMENEDVRRDTVRQIEDTFRTWVESLLDPSKYRAEFGEQRPEGLAVMAHDIESLYRVDWQECAESLLEDVSEA